MVIYIQIGEDYLDTDAQTAPAFVYSNPFFTSDAGTRSIEMSVPRTDKNDRLLGWSNNPDGQGIRHRQEAFLSVPGSSMRCWANYVSYSGGRHNIVLTFATYSYPLGYPLNSVLAFRDNNILVSRTQKAETSGQAPAFGWYIYDNLLTDSTEGNNVGVPLTVTPVANYGNILRTALGGVALNTTETAWPPEDFAVILPTANVSTRHDITVSGSGVSGWTITGGVGTWAAAGLDIVGKRYKRGALNINKTVICFVAIRPIKIEVSEEWEDYIYSTGTGDTYLTEFEQKTGGGTWFRGKSGGYSFSLSTGQYFCVAKNSDSEVGYWRRYWKSHAFEEVITFSFRTVDEGDTVTTGQTMSLIDNLPDMTTQQLLDAYRDITGVLLYYDPAGGRIDALDWEAVRARVNKIDAITIADNDIIDITDIYRYVDGYAQRNIWRTSKEPGNNSAREGYSRIVHVNNDILEAERVVGEIPFAAGEWILYGTPTAPIKRPYVDNVTIQNKLGGAPYAVWTGGGHGIEHLEACTDAGMGVALDEWASEAITIKARFFLNLSDFLRFSPYQGVQIYGRMYLISSGQWSDGVASLTLISL